MTITYQDNGNGTATVAMTYTANKSKLDSVLLDAAHALFDTGYGNHGTSQSPRVWNDLSLNERRVLVDECVKRTMIELAKGYHITAGVEAAKQQAIGELGNYDL